MAREVKKKTSGAAGQVNGTKKSDSNERVTRSATGTSKPKDFKDVVVCSKKKSKDVKSSSKREREEQDDDAESDGEDEEGDKEVDASAESSTEDEEEEKKKEKVKVKKAAVEKKTKAMPKRTRATSVPAPKKSAKLREVKDDDAVKEEIAKPKKRGRVTKAAPKAEVNSDDEEENRADDKEDEIFTPELAKRELEELPEPSSAQLEDVVKLGGKIANRIESLREDMLSYNKMINSFLKTAGKVGAGKAVLQQSQSDSKESISKTDEEGDDEKMVDADESGVLCG